MLLFMGLCSVGSEGRWARKPSPLIFFLAL